MSQNLPADDADIRLVEDSIADAEMTLLALRSAQIANPVRRVKDGVEAFDYLGLGGAGDREETRLPLLVPLDLKLPRIGGLEVLERIRGNERTKLLPVVVLTSSGEGSDIQASYRLGANSYIVKPVDFDKFVEAVSRAGLYWLVTNKPAV